MVDFGSHHYLLKVKPHAISCRNSSGVNSCKVDDREPSQLTNTFWCCISQSYSIKKGAYS